ARTSRTRLGHRPWHPPQIGRPRGATRRSQAARQDGRPQTIPVDDAVRTLEVIVALHVSHDRSAAWTELPLTGQDRQREVRSG
ncbi:MAG: hypothetical protein QGH11_11045, partial [Pirellulaceae bacterium]|nr:hypothetical protein [Pirellulaceae bacterium]